MSIHRHYSKGTARCVANIRQDVSGSNYAHAGLWNPPGSGVYAEVDVISFAGLEGGAPLIVGVWPISSVSGFTIQDPTRVILSDMRLSGRYTPKLQSFVRSGTRSIDTSVASLLRASTDRDTPFSRPQTIVIPPGRGIVAIMDDNNEDLRVSFHFTEYGE